MALSSLAVSRAKPRDKAYKLVDEHGLCLLVTPKGGRYWRYNYRFAGKWRTLALGVFPDVSLAAARAKRDEARQMRSAGNDPAEDRKTKIAQLELDASSTFERVAEEWLGKREREGLGEVTIAKAKWLLGFVYPELGARKISEITSLELLAVLRSVEARGRHESARRLGACVGASTATR